jgi:hypothetical protein
MNRPIDKILERLPDAKPYGKGYRATCPNEHRSKFSLSFSEAEDGRVLLKCFSGCSAAEVLHTLGLELADLFERPTETEKTPRPSWQQRELIKMRQWKACRPDFVGEVNILLSVAGQAYHGYPISKEDKVRTERAARIIRKTLEYL